MSKIGLILYKNKGMIITKIEFLISILIVSILSGCIYQYEQRPVHPQNTQYQEKYYSLRLVSDKVDLDVGYKWNIGGGYVLMVQAIDAKATPRQVWLSLFKDGKQVDDKVLAEGEIYNYQNMTTVNRIYAGGTTDRVILTNTMAYP